MVAERRTEPVLRRRRDGRALAGGPRRRRVDSGRAVGAAADHARIESSGSQKPANSPGITRDPPRGRACVPRCSRLAPSSSIILTVVAGIVFFPQLQAGSTVAWTAALVLAVALAELVAANIAAAPRNAGKPRHGGRAGGIVRFVLRLLLVFVLIAAGWAFVAGGVSERLGEQLVAEFGPDDTVGSSAATPPNPGLIAAKKRLREKAPQVYKSVEQPQLAERLPRAPAARRATRGPTRPRTRPCPRRSR